MARELALLGEQPRPEEGGVSWEGDLASLMRANLWLRTASRVVVRVARFKATAFFELEKRAKTIPWTRFLAPHRYADFRVTARKSRLYHSDAIAERLLAASGSSSPPPPLPPASPALPRQRVGEATPGAEDEPAARAAQLFIVRVVKDQFEISVDASGDLLHLRGYRQAVGKAPLRETLAAALLLSADWSGELPLVDPFCGSGTIPIEGALLARRMAPGLHRRFAFMQWPEFDDRGWRQVRDRARSQQLDASPVPIIGSDRDAGAIESARANAERAGVAADISFRVQSLSAMEPPAPALVATNPPYGVRVSAGSDMRNLYAQLGRVLTARNAGGRLAMLVADRKLARQVGLPVEEAFKSTNGGINVVAIRASVPGASPT